MSTVRRARRNREEMDASIIEYLRTLPPDTPTSVRAVGAAIGVPAGTAQQALRRLAAEGRIVRGESTGRARVWRVAP